MLLSSVGQAQLPTPTPCLGGGDLDPTFDGDGKATTDFGADLDGAFAVVFQPDGKIVAAGFAVIDTRRDFALARYNTDGSLDASFGANGKVTTDFAANDDEAQGVALQADGKIVVAGTARVGGTERFGLARYNANGSLDTTFGTNGKVTIAFGSSDSALAVAVQADGKIVVAGGAFIGGTLDFALARLNPNGSLDTAFDSDGRVTTDFGFDADVARALALQPDGKIVVAGGARFGGPNDFALARYNANGALDSTFDTDGKVTTAFGSGDDEAQAIALQSDGRIIAAGSALIGNTEDFALARYGANGALDSTFDADGKVTTAFGSGSDGAAAVAVQPDGKIIAGGSALIATTDFALARYNADGSPDNTFSTDGKVTTDFAGEFDAIFAVAVQQDGKIVAAGAAFVGVTNDFTLTRYGTCPPPVSIDAITRTGNTVAITLDSFSGYTYRLQRSLSLAPAAFGNIGNAQLGSTGSVLTFTDPNAPANTAFYRVTVGP